MWFYKMEIVDIGIEKNVVLWYIIYKKICEAKNESVDLYRTRKI